jgi:DNA-binding MarR family transcriptional regulator
MRSTLVVLLVSLLIVPGGIAASSPAEDVQASAPGTERLDASAEAGVETEGPVDANASTTTEQLTHAELGGPHASGPDPDLDGGDEGSDEEEDQAEPEPTPLPEPEETAAPAGLAVLGAAAYAAFRWRYLLGGLFAPLYSRLSRDELLENETRCQLHDLIEDEPGLSTQELCDRVDAGWGNTVYHLQRLEQAGFVTSEKKGHHRRFYKNGDVGLDDIEALGVLKNDNANKIARYLVDEPGAKQKDVCEALDISPSLAHKWISRMEEQDLVDSEREWRSKHYEPDDRLERLVQQAA